MAPATSRKDPGPTASDKILDAAMNLFVARGYPSTTVEMIAHAAGVAVQTVYFSFRAKVNILKQLVDINVAGDTTTSQRAWVAEALAEPDPARQLEIQVKGTASGHRRIASLLGVLHRASDTDPTVAELWRTNQDQRRALQHQLMAALRGKGSCPRGCGWARPSTSATPCSGPNCSMCWSPNVAGRSPSGNAGPSVSCAVSCSSNPSMPGVSAKWLG